MTHIRHVNFTVASQHMALQRHAGSSFNSRGTYTHRTIALGFPSLSISATGPSIGIGFGIGHNNYNSPLLRIQGRNVSIVPGS
jgi:hypothetical protein